MERYSNKKVWSKTSKIDKSMRFGVYLNLISDWVILPKTAKAPRFGEIFNFISGWGIWIEGFDSEFFKEGFDNIPFYKDTNFEICKILWSIFSKNVPYTI